MNAHKIEAVLTEDGKLVLNELPFQAGDAVEVIILERADKSQKTESIASDAHLYPLRGSVIQYDEPFESAVPVEDWDALK